MTEKIIRKCGESLMHYLIKNMHIVYKSEVTVFFGKAAEQTAFRNALAVTCVVVGIHRKAVFAKKLAKRLASSAV